MESKSRVQIVELPEMLNYTN